MQLIRLCALNTGEGALEDVRVQQSATLWGALATLPNLDWVDTAVSDHPSDEDGSSIFERLSLMTQIR
jgi:hypothetical protein